MKHHVHLESAMLATILLPKKLDMITCDLCNHPKIFLHEAKAVAHFAKHSDFFVSSDRWRGFCRKLCRICKDPVNEINDHMDENHNMVKFANKSDLEEVPSKTKDKPSVSKLTRIKQYEEVDYVEINDVEYCKIGVEVEEIPFPLKDKSNNSESTTIKEYV